MIGQIVRVGAKLKRQAFRQHEVAAHRQIPLRSAEASQAVPA
jgi:hypothetical protein